MKISKSQLKQIIKEELGRVIEQEGPLKVPSGGGGQQFIDAISKIQGVLREYELDEYTVGTYDPLWGADSGDAWNRYDKQWKLVVADGAFKEARESLLGLLVFDDSGILRIEDVNIPKGRHEANSDAYIMLVDPVNPTHKKGRARVADSIMVGADYADLSKVTRVENPQGVTQ